MKDFFKTIGLGILYIILLPFLLIYLIVYAVYLFFRCIIYTFERLINRKKNKELDDKADKILENSRYVKENSGTKEENSSLPSVESDKGTKIVYNTTNNIILTNPNDLKRTKELLEKDPNYFANHHESAKYIEEIETPLVEHKLKRKNEPSYSYSDESIDEFEENEEPKYLIDDDDIEETQKPDYYGPHSLKRRDD